MSDETPPQTIIDAALGVHRVIRTAREGRDAAALLRVRDAVRANLPALGWALNALDSACRADTATRALTPEHYRQNTDATANRNTKAARLADWGETHGTSPSRLLAMEPPVRRGIERQQGVKRCSDETWEHAATLLASRVGDAAPTDLL